MREKITATKKIPQVMVIGIINSLFPSRGVVKGCFLDLQAGESLYF